MPSPVQPASEHRPPEPNVSTAIDLDEQAVIPEQDSLPDQDDSVPGVDQIPFPEESMAGLSSHNHIPPEYYMSQLEQSIQDLLAIEGATGAAVVDLASGMALAYGGNPGFSLEVAAAGNSNVLRAKLTAMRELGLAESIEDVLITLDSHYHLLNVLRGEANRGLFIYLVLNRESANLALARHKLSVVARAVSL